MVQISWSYEVWVLSYFKIALRNLSTLVGFGEDYVTPMILFTRNNHYKSVKLAYLHCVNSGDTEVIALRYAVRMPNYTNLGVW